MTGTHLDEESARLSLLLTQALAAREEERRCITRRLQEDIGQSLVALAVQLRLAENLCSNQNCTTRIAEARGLLGDALHELERLTRTLYPPALENQGLGPALEVYVKDYAKSANIQVELVLEVLATRPSPDVELALFRIAQEALENVHRHAYATAVRVTLWEEDGQVCLAVEDNGIGYSPEALSGWGFLRMSHRAEALGGYCEFSPTPGEGACIKVVVPLEARSPA